MDTFFNILKKTVVGMVFVIFGMSMVYVPQHFGQVQTVPEAHAATISFDPINWIENAYTAVMSTAMNFFDSAINVKEYVLDGIAWAIAKQIVSGMVSSLVDWINSGFQGSPAFVQDLGGFLLQAADEAFGEFLYEVAPFICSPFRLDVQIALAINYDKGRTNQHESTCTLSGVFNNFEAFIGGEFNQGGWDDWFKLTSQPSVYTEYGTILSAQATARARVINAKGEELNILDFGNGFLSGEVCQQVDSPTGPVEECAISLPGKTIADSLNKALGAGQDALVTADELDEIIVALLGQLANAAIEGASGLLGLSGGTGYTYTGYSRGSFVSELQTGGTTVVGGVTNVSGSTTGSGVGAGDISFSNNFIGDALTEQQASLTRVRNYITQLRAFASNPLNSDQNRFLANTALNEAITYETNLEREINSVAPIVNEYLALETEYVNATTERRIEIRSLQSDIVQRFNTVGLTNSGTLDSVFARWDNILAQNVGSLGPTCTGYVDVNGNGQWDILEGDADCNGTPDIDEIRVDMCGGVPC